jgi:hypothetical protein
MVQSPDDRLIAGIVSNKNMAPSQTISDQRHPL